MKYTLIAEDEFGGSKTTREFTADYLPDVLSEVELFLRGAGFFFTGNLDFVDEYETEDIPEWDTEEFYTSQEFNITNTDLPNNNYPFAGAGYDVNIGGAGNKHSQFYFDTERNR